MDKAQILALADRVEALTGPDREVDEAIFEALFPRGGFDNIPEAMRYVPTHIQSIVPRFTASLDAAMTLVPEGWSFDLTKGWRCDVGKGVSTAVVADKQYGPSDITGHCDGAATPALALTAASLRAMVGGEDAY